MKACDNALRSGEARSPSSDLASRNFVRTYVRTKRLIADLRSVCEPAKRLGTGEPLLFRRSYAADSIMYRNNFARRFISRFYPRAALDLVDYRCRLRHRRRGKVIRGARARKY